LPSDLDGGVMVVRFRGPSAGPQPSARPCR